MPRPEASGVYSKIHERQLGSKTPSSFINAARGSKHFIQRLTKWRVLAGHTGCVNTICWNDSGDTVLSGSDDCSLKVYHVAKNRLLESIRSGHQANIFSAKFLPLTSDKKIVSCCGSGMIHYNELGIDMYYGHNYFNCHAGTTYEVSVIPGNPNSFLSCGEDGTVRHFDLRVKSNCYCQECKDDILVERQSAITSMSVNPLAPHQLGIGCEDSYVRIYDIRYIASSKESSDSSQSRSSKSGLLARFKPKALQKSSCRVTSLQYDESGENLLVSYCSDYVYLFSINHQNTKSCDESGSYASSAIKDDCQSAPLSRLPPIKRLRLRGDWSDTGPSSRPEDEEQIQSRDPNSLMQRISGVFSRWLEDALHDGMNPARRQETDDGESANDRPLVSDSVREDIVEENHDIEVGSNNHAADHLRAGSSLTIDSTFQQPTIDDNLPDSSHISRCCQCCTCFDAKSVSEDSDLNNCSNCQALICCQCRLKSKTKESFTCKPCTDHAKTNENDIISADNDRLKEDAMTNSNAGDCEACNDCITDKAPMQSMTDSSRNDSFKNNQELESVSYPVGHGQHNSASSSSEFSTKVPIVNQHCTHRIDDSCQRDLPIEDNGRQKNSRSDDANVESRTERSVKFDRENNNEADVNGGFALATESETCSNEERIDAATRIQRFFRTSRGNVDLSAAKGYQDPNSLKVHELMCFRGHRNVRTMIKEASFWGSSFVLSGSDCGRVFIWDRFNGSLVAVLEGDQHVVNCVQPHPFDPVLATSGIDYDIKVWAPLSTEPNILMNIDEIISRNEKMLEETRDTITVPASFMLRMLAVLGRRQGRRHSEQQEDSTE
ncbi:DDB1- and CUL4-associated factor 6-like isoform X2 [Rhopilema esculentum]|uniref:DDB1- and CUL4-associated factor 6-like isoform X2 n=1 Tax=Rhopilema esculentum TaxID=499914 RepID=UPI0031E09B45